MSEGLVAVDDLFAGILAGTVETPAPHPRSAIRRHTVAMQARDGVSLATDVYLAEGVSRGPIVVMRTPYGRRLDVHEDLLWKLAEHGYAAVSQDCRGTGDSEPDTWDTYIYEQEDSWDCVEWLTRQPFYDGFIGGTGASYLAGTQWAMALHPQMSAIAPEVGGLGGVKTGANLHMGMNTYALMVGKGPEKESTDPEADLLPGFESYAEMEHALLPETLATGYYDAPVDPPLPAMLLDRFPQLRTMSLPAARSWLWQYYSASPPRERAELLKQILDTEAVTLGDLENLPPVFGHTLHLDRHLTPVVTDEALFDALRAPSLMIAGWYDWGLDIVLRTWGLLARHAREDVREGSRLLITPNSHNWPGYREGEDPVLERTFREAENLELLLRWYGGLRGEEGVDSLPRVTYYLMGGGGWQVAEDWPPPGARETRLHLASGGRLTLEPPEESEPDTYAYDPDDPTPTVGGSICSFVYTPGSADVSEAQARDDVLVYTGAPLEADLTVVGPLRLVLYASSSARDTDFYARLSDVFPDGRAICLQNGVVRARLRDPRRPAPLEPDRVHRFEIDMWATANRFAAGHRLRVDISSADFPRFDRNANVAGEGGDPVRARQTIYHEPGRASHLVMSVLDGEPPS